MFFSLQARPFEEPFVAIGGNFGACSGWGFRVPVEKKVSIHVCKEPQLRFTPQRNYAFEVLPTRVHGKRHITLSEARSRLYRSRSSQVNSHFAAFFKISKICTLLHRSELKCFGENCVKFSEILQSYQIFSKILKFFKML